MSDRKIIEGLIEELENHIFEEEVENDEIENLIEEIETDWIYRGIPEDLIEKAKEIFLEEYGIED